MQENTIISLADSNYFNLLNELIDSINRFEQSKTVDICVMDAGLTEEQIKILEKKVFQIKKAEWDIKVPNFKVKGREWLKSQVSRAFLQNYFPGYIMIKANLSGEVPHIIRSITNVIGFLGETKGGEPVPLRPSEVNRLLGKVDELSEQTENILIPFKIGETIKVIDGPFNGFNGSIEKVNEEKRKLEVMVKIFGRKTPLELSYMQVEKI